MNRFTTFPSHRPGARRVVSSAIVVGLVLAAAALATPRLEDPHELEAFLDGLIGEHRAGERDPATVVVVVRDGRTLLARGYGMADIEAGTPADPASTLFPLGALAEVFAAVSTLKLVDMGRLDLDAEVATLVDRPVVPPGPGPSLTVRHLLTHSAGLDVGPPTFTRIGLAAPPAAPTTSVSRAWVTTAVVASPSPAGDAELPRRLHLAGSRYSPSPASASLLETLLERVAGEPLPAFARRWILPPSVAPPGAEARGTGLAHPYLENPLTGQWWRLPHFAPRSGAHSPLVVSGQDMAALMKVLLGSGSDAGRRVLSPESVAALLTPSFFPHPGLPGLTLGGVKTRRGVEWVGRLPPFPARLVLLPERGVGIFVTSGFAPRLDLAGVVTQRLLARYFPEPAREADPVASSGSPVTTGCTGAASGVVAATDLVGSYRSSHYPRTSVFKVHHLLAPIDPEYRVQLEGGCLTVATLADPWGEPLVEVGGGVYRIAPDGPRMAFSRDAAGAVRVLVQGESLREFERIAGYETRPVQLLLGLFFLAVFLWVGPVAVLRRVYQWLTDDATVEKFLGRPVERHNLVAGLLAWANLLVMLQPLLVLAPAPPVIPGWLDLVLRGLLFLGVSGWIFGVLAVGLLRHSLRVLGDPARPWTERLAFLGTNLVLIAFVPFGIYWNLIG